MGSEASVDERVFHGLRIQHCDLTHAACQRKRLGGGMLGSLAAEVRILRGAHRRREPQPAFPIKHRVVIVDPRIPDLFVAPIGRRRHRLLHRRMAGAERFRHLRIAHRGREARHLVGVGIENRENVSRVFRRANEQAITVHRRVAAVRRDQVMQVFLRVAPFPGSDHDIAFDPLRPRWLRGRKFALGHPVGPVAEIFERHAAELAGKRVHHRLGCLS